MEVMTATITEETDMTHITTRRIRGRTLGLVAGAAVIAVLSAGVGAGAATLVTSAQIKDGTIVGRDVKDAGLTGRDVRARSLTGKHVKDGTVTGADVKNGSIDTADLSTNVSVAMVNGKIPSGTTVTGIEAFDVNSDVAGDYSVSVTLPGRASAALTSDVVNFGGNSPMISDGSPGCTGTTAAPTAPAGKVCIYLIAAASDSASFFGTDIGGVISDQAFAVYWFDDATSNDNVFAKFTWAYTAP